MEIALILELPGNAGALLVEHVAVEQYSRAQFAAVYLLHNEAAQGGVGHIVANRFNTARLSGDDGEIHLHTSAFGVTDGVDFHNGVHIAAVDHGLLQLMARAFGGISIVYDRRLPHAAQPAVVPLCGVAARKGVGAQR